MKREAATRSAPAVRTELAARAAPAPAISVEGRGALLTWARACLAAAVERRAAPWIDDDAVPPELRVAGSAFVTLTEAGELRGCMGRLDGTASAWSNVSAAAAMAATRDPRFLPVSADELDRIDLEVSVLGPFEDIPAPEWFDPLVHGIVAERGLRRGLLLPQVAREQGWGREETLAAVCWKAGLDPDAWRDPGTRLQVFTATVFGEDDAHEVPEEPPKAGSTEATLPA
jgi:AmmeMemoRadiSam system protein A